MATKKPTNRDIEKALAVMKQLGYKVDITSTSETIERQEASAEKLGFKNIKSKPEPVAKKLEHVLGAQHIVAGQTYGPGKITLEPDQVSLFNSLIHQDNLVKQAFMDNSRNNGYSRCYLIKPGRAGGDNHNKYSKVEVSESQFNSDQVWENVTLTAGQSDIAGFSNRQDNF